MLGEVAFGVMPVFALANAGVAISGDAFSRKLASMVFRGTFLGLLIGMPLGITGVTWLAVRTQIAELQVGITWRHVIGWFLLSGTEKTPTETEEENVVVRLTKLMSRFPMRSRRVIYPVVRVAVLTHPETPSSVAFSKHLRRPPLTCRGKPERLFFTDYCSSFSD